MRRRWAVATAALVVLIGLAAAADAAVVQVGKLRITVQSRILPFKLPRQEAAPIAVFLSGHLASTTGEVPPQLRKMTIEINRNGLLDYAGLPTCTLAQIQPGSSDRAIANCGDALVGSGRFWASVVFPEQRPYPTRGRLLVFNGRRAGRPVLFAHIYTEQPVNTSFVITFAIKRIDDGLYGTEFSASLPQALGDWGFVDRIKLTLRRKFTYRGKQRSFFNAACPAPKGTRTTVYPLAFTTFDFESSKRISVPVTKSCRVKE
jgi:hypothetical protein